MPFQSTIGKSVGKLIKSFRNQDMRTLKGVEVNRWEDTSVTSTGGDQQLIPGNGYKYHTFTTSGSLVVSAVPGVHPGKAELLMVAGGGSGGNGYYGGAGAGGVIHCDFPLQETTYPVTIGAGGVTPGNGSDTLVAFHPIGTLQALGGGYAGTYSSTAGADGGSGGGEQDQSTGVGQGLQPTLNPNWTPQPNFNQYGNPGGYGNQTGAYQSAGGGGAGAAGQNPSPAYPGPYGHGGAGQPIPGFEYPIVGLAPVDVDEEANSPTSNHYGGGGGGWGYVVNPGGDAVVRAAGGGGSGRPGPPTGGPWTSPGKGTDALGGGGGSTVTTGGSGSVIFRILIT